MAVIPIAVDPVTRIEGHLKADIEVDTSRMDVDEVVDRLMKMLEQREAAA